MNRMILFATLAAVAGCSQEPQTATQPPQPGTTAQPGTIPADLQGRWALTPRDCGADGDPRGLLTIGPVAFAFAAAPVTVDRVILRPGRVAFDTQEEEDGATANRRYLFHRSGDGGQLTHLRPGLPDQVYTRCPNPPS